MPKLDADESSPGFLNADLATIPSRWFALGACFLAVLGAAFQIIGMVNNVETIVIPVRSETHLPLLSYLGLLLTGMALLMQIEGRSTVRLPKLLTLLLALSGAIIGITQTIEIVPQAGISLVLAGAGIACLISTRSLIRVFAQWAALGIAFQCTISIVTNAYGLSFLYPSGYFSQIPVQFSLLLFFFSLSLFFLMRKRVRQPCFARTIGADR
jgi:hypothetical protein